MFTFHKEANEISTFHLPRRSGGSYKNSPKPPARVFKLHLGKNKIVYGIPVCSFLRKLSTSVHGFMYLGTWVRKRIQHPKLLLQEGVDFLSLPATEELENNSINLQFILTSVGFSFNMNFPFSSLNLCYLNLSCIDL